MRKATTILAALVLAMPLSFVVAESPTSPMLDDGVESIDPGFESFVKHTPDSSGEIDPDELTELLDEANDREPQFVFGADDRVRLSPADPRVAWVVSSYANGDVIGYCSASFIGSNVLLTAAHCLYNNDPGYEWAGAVVVAPGNDANVAPYDVFDAEQYFVSTGWIDTAGDPLYDIGVIVLSDHVGSETGWFDIGLFSDPFLARQDLGVASIGYPADKALGTQWLASEPALSDLDQDFLFHELDQIQGQSGASLITITEELIFGITSAEFAAEEIGSINIAVRINNAVIELLDSICIDAGCSFTYYEDPAQPPPQQPDPDPGPSDPGQVAAAAIARTWAYTDFPVANGDVARTWMWGPEPFEGGSEPYIESPGGQRNVIYYDKARMEITNPNDDSNSEWYVTNGLLVQEMIGGRVQTGNASFDESPSPANVNVAGDPNDPNGPTYASFAGLTGPAAAATGNLVTNRVDRGGNVTQDPSLAGQNVVLAHYDDVTGHNVAGPFWNFMNSEGPVYQNDQMYIDDLFANPYYATGRPITEPYFANVQVGGTVLVVLMQCFERRCLTYTPTNPAGYQVEAGNVGLHYYCWRYGELPAGKGECTPQDDPGPSNGVPAETELIDAIDLTSWPQAGIVSRAFGMPTDAGYLITTLENAWMQMTAPAGDYQDASVSVDFRVTEPAPRGSACVLSRVDPDPDDFLEFNVAAYHLCAVYTIPPGGGDPLIQEVVAYYESVEDLFELGRWDLAEPISASSWNELKIIAQGNTFWFLLNGSLISSIQDNGATSGTVGVSADYLGAIEFGASLQQFDIYSEVEFRDLNVYMVD